MFYLSVRRQRRRGISDRDISMRAKDAEKWFGVNPPDLSLIARSRGADWLYTYLKSFYVDVSRPFGVNIHCSLWLACRMYYLTYKAV